MNNLFKEIDKISFVQRSNRAAILIASSCSGIFGGSMFMTILIWWMILQGFTYELAYVLATRSIIQFISAFVFGPILDRASKSQMQNWSGVGVVIGAIISALPILLDKNGIFLVLIGQSINSLSMSIIIPLRQTMIIETERAERVPRILASQKALESTARTLGPLFAALALHFWDVRVAASISTFTLCVGIVLGLYVRPTDNAVGFHRAFKSWFNDFAAGIRVRYSIRIERYTLIIGTIQGILYMPFITSQVPLLTKKLGLNGEWLGIFEAALAVGAISGALIITFKILRVYAYRYEIVVITPVVSGSAMLAASYFSNPYLIATMYFVCNFAVTLTAMIIFPHRMLAIPPEYRNRLNATSTLSGMLCMSLGPLIGIIMTEMLSIDIANLILASGYIVVATCIIFVPGYKHFITLNSSEVEGWYKTKYPELFS